MNRDTPALEAHVVHSLGRAVPPEILAMADALRGELGSGVAAILAYGSCLRGVAVAESLIDLYVLTTSSSSMPVGNLARLACRLIPPNVYYAECPYEGGVLRCKYALLPLDQFRHWMAPATSNPYFWARFAQPSALVYCANTEMESKLVAAIALAHGTAFGNARGTAIGEADPLVTWQKLFEHTYATELRSELTSRASELVKSNRDYYQTAADLLRDEAPIAGNWRWRRLTGRFWSVARLVKAAFTFTGGADYLAWKIERHSGYKVQLSNWQRRHPLLASITLLPKLLRKGAVR